MNEQIFEQAVNTLSITFMAGRVLVALGTFRKKKEEHGQTSLSMPPSYIESRKALEGALAFIKKASSAEEYLKQNRLSLSSLESFEAYTIVLESLRSGGEDLLKGRDFSVFLKTIESTIEVLLKDGNISPDSVEATRLFFSQLMHFASTQSSRLLMKESAEGVLGWLK